LSNRAWKRRCGCCLALRYSTHCKARDLSRPSAFAVDLARMRALTDPLLAASRVDEVGALPSGRVVLSRPSSGTTPPSDALVAAPHFPLVGYRRACFPSPAGSGPPRASPVSTTPLLPF